MWGDKKAAEGAALLPWHAGSCCRFQQQGYMVPGGKQQSGICLREDADYCKSKPLTSKKVEQSKRKCFWTIQRIWVQ